MVDPPALDAPTLGVCVHMDVRPLVGRGTTTPTPH